MLSTGLLKQIHWLIFLPIAFISLFHFPVQKIISGTYQETISGRVCTLQTLSLANEVSRKTTIGSQWYPHIANVFNLYFSCKVICFLRKVTIKSIGQESKTDSNPILRCASL